MAGLIREEGKLFKFSDVSSVGAYVLEEFKLIFVEAHVVVLRPLDDILEVFLEERSI